MKCEGIGEPWSFCDDRDFAPDFAQTLDKVLFELACLSGDALGPKPDPDQPIARYTRRYRGVKKVSLFYERAGEARRRIQLSPSHTVPKLGAEATPRQIAEVVFDLFKYWNANTTMR